MNATEITVEDAQRRLRAEYWGDVRSIVDEAKELVAKGELADREALDEWLWQSVDGSARVIYTGRAIECLLYSDHEDAMVEEFGSEGLVEGGQPNWSGMAFHAFLADARSLLDDVEFPDED